MAAMGDPWAIPYFCYALLGMGIISAMVQVQAHIGFRQAFDHQLAINKRLEERLRLLEEEEDAE